MCRLFAMSAPQRVPATFWLLQAPDSLLRQSHANPDGTGIGIFDESGEPRVDRQAIAAYEDSDFAQEARNLVSRTFVSHVRHASNGANREANTHPFEMDGRLFAHNGVIGDADKLNQRLGHDLALVEGDTDSERYFALITVEIRRAGGDIGLGIARAVQWVDENLGVYAANFVLTTPTELWAFRFPEPNTLFYLDRDPATAEQSGLDEQGGLDQQSEEGTKINSEPLADLRSVIVASEKLDGDRRWQPFSSGQLLHVDADMGLHSVQLTGKSPQHPLTLADLGKTASKSQR